MKASNGYSSFFNSLSVSNHPVQPAHAIALIQRWWKHVHLRHMASELFAYVDEVISLEAATQFSYEQLQEVILNPQRIARTRSVLTHLEHIKDHFIPERVRLTHQDLARPFLAAYLIATQFNSFLDASSATDQTLQQHALEMLNSFEQLIVFSKEYSFSSHKNTLEENQLGQYYATFHTKQLNFYYSFKEWKKNDCDKPASVYLAFYLQLELKRLTLLNNLDTRLFDLYDSLVCKQEQLKKNIGNLLGNQGLEDLAHQVRCVRELFEIKKWMNATAEQLMHEQIINPNFSFHPQAFTISPKIDIDTALKALPNEDLLLSLLAELVAKIKALTPNNPAIVSQLYDKLNHIPLHHFKVYEGGMHIIMCLIQTLFFIEAPVHQMETLETIKQHIKPYNNPKEYPVAFKHALEFIFAKIAQINLEQNNLYLKQAHSFISQHIIPFEQKKFQEHIIANQVTLRIILKSLDQCVEAPEAHRLSLSVLCSEHIGNYLTHSLILELLQNPQPILYIIPETFYLDTERLIKAHEHYHQIVYVATLLSYIEHFCQKYNITLSITKLGTQKDKMMLALKKELFLHCEDRIDYMVTVLEKIIQIHEQTLSSLDKKTFIRLIKELECDKNPVEKVFNHRLNNLLAFYFTKGCIPKTHLSVFRNYGLDKEVNLLAKQLMPIIGLHSQVYSAFYQQHVEKRLWSPLFSLLEANTLPAELPILFLAKEEAIHSLYVQIHKLAFLVSGLTLIKQTLTYSDLWLKHITLDNSALKKYVGTLSLYGITSSGIKEQLSHLMHTIAEKEEITLDKKVFSKQLMAAQQKHSPNYKANIDELLSYFKSIIFKRPKPIHKSHLLAEFSDEVEIMATDLKKIIIDIKKHQLSIDNSPTAITLSSMMRAGFS